MNAYQQLVLSDVTTAIFTWERQFFQKEIEDVVARNIELLGPNTAYGFVFGDKWYASAKMVGRANQSLHQSLYPTMQRIVDHQRTVENDKQLIRQTLGRLITACSTRAEMRNELPEVVIEVDPMPWQFDQRTRDPAQSIKNNPLAYRQYEKVLAKIHQYAAMRYML